MRIGISGYHGYQSPEEWVAYLKSKRYRTTTAPIGVEAAHDDDTIKVWRDAARQADVIISEVGAWCNPMSADEAIRVPALERCKDALLLAEKLEANCAVNIAGSIGDKWDGPDPRDFTDEAFQMIVDTTREIIDAVEPVKSCYALEAMPWMYPDSPDTYLKLLKAVDRKGMGVHLDPVNMISSPQKYYRNGDFIKECFQKLGPWIRNCHGKDIKLGDTLTTHLSEVIPGTGFLDYKVFLTELEKLGPDACLIVEHLSTLEEYDQATSHVLSVADSLGIKY